MKNLDFLTPAGVAAGILMIGIAVAWNGGLEGFSSFLHLPSFLIVFGGILAAMLVSFPIRELKRFGRVSVQSFKSSKDNLRETVDLFVHLSEIARKEGILSLEKELAEIHNPFIKRGIYLTIDGVDAETIENILHAEMISLEERHRKGRRMVEKAGDYAPAWGMIGTLIGLILMLKDLNDPASLGPNMAIALLTTFYGVLLANLVFNPMAAKLATSTEKELFTGWVIVEGVIGIHNGQNPRVLEDQLAVYLTGEEMTPGVRNG
ncbi:MotA/TolQ/ExbB proton channel family protein [Jeotgalibacillus proteolyticus]|uniref:MotA/TolQ/ExbB proton channel family protein n=1 Tax=Jeotgalibacillus proteolyticus TaxID=2082395 RepID=UPI003CE96D89